MLFIIDREKDIMKCKGYHVNPSEIENIIESIDGVQAVAVIGIPDQLSINLPAAVIVKSARYDNLTEQNVKDFVAERLADYKHLHGGVYFVDQLPLTESGKIRKKLVAEQICNTFFAQRNTKPLKEF